MTKGDIITIPIQVLNRSVELWGEDAREFRPDRWSDLPESVKEIPNVTGNTLTFMAGGHACIGYRFSIAEYVVCFASETERCELNGWKRTKALLFAIVRHFEFELAISPLEITRKTHIVSRPTLVSNPDAGAQLPLLIRPVSSV
jgi:cytochrome P450